MSMEELKLCLPDGIEFSDFMLEMITEEVEEINNSLQIEEGEIEIKTNYVHELEDKLEVCIYLLNNTTQKINFERLDLSLVKNSVELTSQAFTSKEFGEIPPKSIKYCVLYFEKANITEPEFEGIMVLVKNDTQINAKATIYVDLVNLPNTINKKDVKEINKYIESLPYLGVNTIDINVFSLFYDQDNNLSMILIIRNGYEDDVKLAAIPVKVYDSMDNLVYSGEFSPVDFSIKSNTAIISNFIVREKDIFIRNADFSKYRVEFK